MGKSRGVSPVIATVLLIAIVFVLAVIIFLWARGFVTEGVEKFGRAVEFACDDIVFEAGYFDGSIEITNKGNVPIYGLNIKDISAGEVFATEIFDGTITSGQGKRIDFNPKSGSTKINVVPMILGETKSGKVAHTCSDEFGFTVSI